MSTLRPLVLTALCVLLGAMTSQAQDPVAEGDTPANLSYVDGAVDLVHDGVSERADAPLLLLEGDIVRTQHGRAEIVFGDGTLLHLDQRSEIELLSPTRVRLSQGRISVRVSPAARTAYVIDTPGGSVSLEARGEFGVTADRSGALDVRVARGAAEIDDGGQRIRVRAGEMVALAQPGARAEFRAFNSARWDGFSAWAHDRAQGSTASPSAARLPSELRVYSSVLDHHGRWDYDRTYGYVWFPSVAVAWRPYYDGRWAHTRYGWTWYGYDRWAWPTHHYGRWGFNGAAWFWIPRAGWGPGWVSWGVAPGYVSWAPLGWDDSPAIGLWPRRDHPAYWPHDPWRGWTVVPRDRFGRPGGVRSAAIDGRRLDDRTRGAMIIQNNGPGAAGSAVPRGTFSVPGVAGNVRRLDPRGDVPGSVRRPPPAPAGLVGSRPARRPTDAPAYAPEDTPDPGARIRSRANDGSDTGWRAEDIPVHRGSVRSANPETRPRPGDGDRPTTAAPGDYGDDARARRVDPAAPRMYPPRARPGAGADAGPQTGSESGAGSSGGRTGGARPGAVRGAPRGDGPRGSTPSTGGARPRGSAGDSGGDPGAVSRGGARPR